MEQDKESYYWVSI